MTDNVTAICIHDAKASIAGLTADADIETRLRAAMKATRGHWLCTNEESQMRAAVAAVMTHYGADSPESRRLAREWDMLAKFGAMMHANSVGVPVTLADALGDFIDDGFEPLGIMRLWNEGRNAR